MCGPCDLVSDILMSDIKSTGILQAKNMVYGIRTKKEVRCPTVQNINREGAVYEVQNKNINGNVVQSKPSGHAGLGVCERCRYICVVGATG